MPTDHTFVRSPHTTSAWLAARPLSSLGLLSSLLICGGCTDQVQPLSPAGNAPAGSAQSAAPATVKPSTAQLAGWLTTDLPALQEEIAATPVTLKEPQLVPNEWGQEILRVLYERPAVVRTLPAEVNLVLLPTPAAPPRPEKPAARITIPRPRRSVRAARRRRGRLSGGVRSLAVTRMRGRGRRDPGGWWLRDSPTARR